MSLLNKISPVLLSFLSDKAYSVVQYVYKQRRFPDLKNPRTFNEKIQWLKLNCRDPRLTSLVDKYEVRRYVESKVGAKHLIPLLGVYENPSEIEFHKLPARFVLKATHGSGWNILCRDQAQLDVPAARITMTKWQATNFYRVGREWAYLAVPPRILCEEMITDAHDNPPPDYKFFCFHGKPCFIQVDLDRFSGHRRNMYDSEWQLLPLEFEYPSEPNQVPPPANLSEMLQIAARLSEDFPFVRVDLYSVLGKVYFGELTFYPEKGVGRFRPAAYDRVVGDCLDLSKVLR